MLDRQLTYLRSRVTSQVSGAVMLTLAGNVQAALKHRKHQILGFLTQIVYKVAMWQNSAKE